MHGGRGVVQLAGLDGVMASASVGWLSYTPSSERYSSHHRTPLSRDKPEGYGTPGQAGRRAAYRAKGLEEASLRPDDSFLSSQQASFFYLRSEPDASRMVAEEKEEGGCVDWGLVLSSMGHRVLWRYIDISVRDMPGLCLVVVHVVKYTCVDG